MKKFMLFLPLILLLFMLLACGKGVYEKEFNISSSSIQENMSKTVKNERIKGIDLHIGSSYSEIIKKFGEPIKKGIFEGGQYLDYNDITFFTDNIEEGIGKLTSIVVRGKREIYGVNIGMTPSEIKEILGTPYFEGLNDDTEIGGWVISYMLNNRNLSFNSDTKDSATTLALLKLHSQK